MNGDNALTRQEGAFPTNAGTSTRRPRGLLTGRVLFGMATLVGGAAGCLMAYGFFTTVPEPAVQSTSAQDTPWIVAAVLLPALAVAVMTSAMRNYRAGGDGFSRQTVVLAIVSFLTIFAAIWGLGRTLGMSLNYTLNCGPRLACHTTWVHLLNWAFFLYLVDVPIVLAASVASVLGMRQRKPATRNEPHLV